MNPSTPSSLRTLTTFLLVPLVCLWGAYAAAAETSGEQVKRAIRRGSAALRSQQGSDGAWPDRYQPGGTTCLATFTLLQAGDPVESEHISRALPVVLSVADQHVYTTALKIMVLTQADPQRYRREIGQAARFLIDAQNPSGLWTYEISAAPRYDHSNSQFALLGLHAAAQVGVRIPTTTWRNAEKAILATQNPDGGWPYRAPGDSYGSMTAAGVADLIIVGQRLEQVRRVTFRPSGSACCEQVAASAPLMRGLEWLGREFRPNLNPGRGRQQVFYWLYAIERCGILTGQRFFGGHDWYRAGAEYLIAAQDSSGLWANNLPDTCFAILFLAKGHKSLLMQKLQLTADGPASSLRSDLDNLVAFIGDDLGEPVTWQSVPVGARSDELLAAPLLLLQGRKFPRLNDGQRAALREYVAQGGTLLAEASCGEREFTVGFERFITETCPEAPLRTLGPTHAVYHVLHEVGPYPAGGDAPKYALHGIDLGCRTAVIFSPRDLSCFWAAGDVPAHSERAFQLGANIAAYAVGRRPLRDRLDAVVVPRSPPATDSPPVTDALRLTQVVYEGDWRPFPTALVELAEFLRDELATDVVTQYRAVRLSDESLYAGPILLLAGHFDFELPETDRRTLAEHLRRGGFLIADACCGTEPFDTAFRRLMQQTFPDATLTRLPRDHPVFAGKPGFRIDTVRYSPDVARARPGLETPELWGLELDGRLAVVYSPYSLSCGLAGPAFDGCWGLSSADARRVAANIVLYALTH